MTQAAADGATEFADFYAVNFPRIAGQVYAYLGDHAEAQDVTQEAFVRALDRWSKVSTYDHAQVWVRQVAWNLATSRLRHLQVARRYLARQRVEHVDEPSPDRIALVEALAQLPAKHRLAVVLHHLGHLSTAEIAEQEGVAEGTVRSWLSRGRARLAEHFEESLSTASVRPPGVQAAANTVRRRRTARRATLAAVLALVIAIPVAILLRAKGDEPPIIGPTTPPASPSPGPEIRKIGLPVQGRPDVHFVDGRHAWLLLGRTLASTSDGGVSWQRVTLLEIPGNVNLSMHVLDAQTLTLRVTEESADTPREFRLTRDGGATWTTHPWANPPVEARLTSGLYQMLCPGAHGLEDGANGTECDRRNLVKVGSGLVSPQPPWRGDTAGVLTGADGRLWLHEGYRADARLAVSTDGAKTWLELPPPPGDVQLSVDGKHVFAFSDRAVWEFTGGEWRYVFAMVNPMHSAAFLGDGLWLVKQGEGVAYLKDGRYTFVSEVGPVSGFRVLPDRTLILFGDDGLWLGYGAGQNREWVLIES